MKNKLLLLFLIFCILGGCVGSASKGVFGTGVSIAFDPRSLGTQIDDTIMQKNLTSKINFKRKKLFFIYKNQSFGWSYNSYRKH